MKNMILNGLLKLYMTNISYDYNFIIQICVLNLCIYHIYRSKNTVQARNHLYLLSRGRKKCKFQRMIIFLLNYSNNFFYKYVLY